MAIPVSCPKAMSSRLLQVASGPGNGEDGESPSEMSSSEFFDEEARILGTQSPIGEKLSEVTRRWMALFVWLLTLGPLLLNLLRMPLPDFMGLSLAVWARYGLIVVLMQAVIRVGIYGVVRWLRRAEARRLEFGDTTGNIDLASHLEAIVVPLTSLFTTIGFALAWYSVYPIGCPNDPSPAPVPEANGSEASGRIFILLTSMMQGICVYDFVTDAIVSTILASAVLALEIGLMRAGLWGFLRSNFLERILENRYRTYVVEQVRQQTLPPADSSRRISEPIAFPFALPFHVPYLDRLRAWLNAGILDEDTRTFDAQISGRPLAYSEYRRRLGAWIARHGLDEAVDQVARSIPQTDGEAKAAAKEIFSRLRRQDRDYLLPDDMAVLFQGRAATRDAYAIFDRDQDGSVSKTEFRHTCVMVYREMRNLALSVQDAGRAFRQLADSLHLFVLTALFFITLAIFGVRVYALSALVFSLLLGLNVLVGDVAKRAFQGIIFLFIDHPYDVGDRVLVQNLSDNDPLNVQRISMLTTVFTRWNGQQVYVPNSLLANATIYNVSRTAEQWDRIRLTLKNPHDQSSPKQAGGSDPIANLRDAIESFLKRQPADFMAAYELKPIIAGELGKSETDLEVIQLVLGVQCRPTVDSQKRWTRHARLMAFVKQAVTGAGLTLVGAPKSDV